MTTINQLLSEIKKTNLCTWYLLPITGLNKFSFGEGLFVNSYLDKNRLWIIVQVPDLLLVPRYLMAYSAKNWQNDRGGFLAYEIDSMWSTDVQSYIQGNYTMFSGSLKALICEMSGLTYQELDSGKTHTDIRLLALQGDETLKQYLMEELQVSELPEELLPKPSIESFMDVEG